MLSICNGHVFTEKLKSKFLIDDEGFYYNERLRAEVKKRKDYAESRRKNARAYAEHMEDENENENKDVIKDKDRDKRGIIKGEFEKFWELYPRKVGKGAARTAYERATKKEQPFNIYQALQNQEPYLKNQEKKYIPHPTTWLNQERWGDSLEDLKKGMGDGKPTTQDIYQNTMETMRKIKEQGL